MIPSGILDADYTPEGKAIVQRLRAGTKGGQHANKNETGVRLRHGDIEIISTGQRSLVQNLKWAEAEMKRRLSKMAQDERQQKLDKRRRVVSAPSRAAKVMTWNWQRGEAIHHGTGKRLPLARALKGELDKLLA